MQALQAPPGPSAHLHSWALLEQHAADTMGTLPSRSQGRPHKAGPGGRRGLDVKGTCANVPMGEYPV